MTTAALSPAYAAACEASRIAFEAYEAERKIFADAAVADYPRFAAAQAAYKIAQDAFDVAFAKEAGWTE